MRRLALLGLCLLLLAGCGGKRGEREGDDASRTAETAVNASRAEETAAPTVTPVPMAAPTDTPTPIPTPTPLYMLREEGGNDLIINDDLYDSFTQTEFPLPSAPVVLIYHTHAEEAYRQTRSYAYAETGKEVVYAE